jgi:hypothetical protein
MFRMAMMGAPTLSLISCGGNADSSMLDRNSSVQSCSQNLRLLQRVVAEEGGVLAVEESVQETIVYI